MFDSMCSCSNICICELVVYVHALLVSSFRTLQFFNFLLLRSIQIYFSLNNKMKD